MAEKQIKVELRDPKELKPYEFNNKTHPRSQLDELIKSIQEDWFRWVVTVDENDVIISGHGRVMACIELWIKVPTIKYDDMDQVQKIRNRIKDNRINDLADWEYKNISHELDELHWLGYDDLDELMAPFIDDLEPDEDYIDNNVRVDKFKNDDQADIATSKVIQLVYPADKYVEMAEKLEEIMETMWVSTISEAIYLMVLSYNATEQ